MPHGLFFTIYILRHTPELQEIGFRGVCALSSTAEPQTLVQWMRLNLEKLRWRRIYHKPTGARLIVVQDRKRASMALLSNCDSGDATTTTHRSGELPVQTSEVRAPSTQALYNKYKCSAGLWNKMVLHYDHRGKTGNKDVAITQSLIHALTLQAFTYWRLATGGTRSHLEFRYDVLRHFAPPARPRSVPVAEQDGADHVPVKLLKPRGRCARPGCTSTHPAYECRRCKKPLCIPCFDPYH